MIEFNISHNKINAAAQLLASKGIPSKVRDDYRRNVTVLLVYANHASRARKVLSEGGFI